MAWKKCNVTVQIKEKSRELFNTICKTKSTNKWYLKSHSVYVYNCMVHAIVIQMYLFYIKLLSDTFWVSGMVFITRPVLSHGNLNNWKWHLFINKSRAKSRTEHADGVVTISWCHNVLLFSIVYTVHCPRLSYVHKQ